MPGRWGVSFWIIQSRVDLPYEIVRQQIANCVQLVVHLDRSSGRRRVAEVLRLDGLIDEAGGALSSPH